LHHLFFRISDDVRTILSENLKSWVELPINEVLPLLQAFSLTEMQINFILENLENLPFLCQCLSPVPDSIKDGVFIVADGSLYRNELSLSRVYPLSVFSFLFPIIMHDHIDNVFFVKGSLVDLSIHRFKSGIAYLEDLNFLGLIPPGF
jgi:hypothetical protein